MIKNKPQQQIAQKIYRKGVGIMLINKNKQIFLGKRRDTENNTLQMPQGGIDENESPTAAAMRELKEEIGTNNIEILYETQNWLKYDFPSSIQKILYQGKYAGQTHKWFLAKFLGNDNEINIQTEPTPEFENWGWYSIEEMQKYVVYFKRALYQNIIKNFYPIINKIK